MKWRVAEIWTRMLSVGYEMQLRVLVARRARRRRWWGYTREDAGMDFRPCWDVMFEAMNHSLLSESYLILFSSHGIFWVKTYLPRSDLYRHADCPMSSALRRRSQILSALKAHRMSSHAWHPVEERVVHWAWKTQNTHSNAYSHWIKNNSRCQARVGIYFIYTQKQRRKLNLGIETRTWNTLYSHLQIHRWIPRKIRLCGIVTHYKIDMMRCLWFMKGTNLRILVWRQSQCWIMFSLR